MNNNTLTTLTGVKVGHSTHIDKLTGCTVILFDKPYPVAYKAYGGGCGTFNTDMLRNGMSFYRRHGLFIAGGSMTGLMSATSIMQEMIKNSIGFKDRNIINPAISGAIVFDLGTRIGQYDPLYGKEAFNNASSTPVQNGNVGAGTGTTVGKFQYIENGSAFPGMKAGVGSACIRLGNGILVCALSVVNAVGNIIKADGTILAGNRDENNKFKTFEDITHFVTKDTSNTTITIVGTNVNLHTRENYERVAHVASHGQVRAINPVHTSIDGDTVFVFSTEEITSPLNDNATDFEQDDWPDFTVDIIGQAAARAVQESIYNACYEAKGIVFKDGYNGVVPSCNEYS